MFVLRCGAQNLVPNPGFEEYKNLPWTWNTDTAAFRDYVTGWYEAANTSADILSTLVPKSAWSNTQPGDSIGVECRAGILAPHSGNVMAGLFTYVPTHKWHEYIQVKLLQPLIPGRHYCISMWVSPANNNSHASNNIGMLFTRDPVRGDSEILAKPQFNVSKVIADTGKWILISGGIDATEADEYLTIGNFFPDSETILTPIGNDFCYQGAYFFIDDVTVMLCPV